MKRENVTVSLYSDTDELRMTIPEAVEWLRELAEQVPAEYRDQSIFEIEQDHDYYGGSSTLWVRAYYTRSETDGEMAERERQRITSEAHSRAMNEARERQIYQQLKAKFEGAAR